MGDIQPRLSTVLGDEAERRSKLRFPLALGVCFVTRRPPLISAGQTVNLSSTGALIASQQRLRVGTKIELFVDWPIMLNGTMSLRFVARGRVKRSDSSIFAVSLQQYEFRTTKKRPQSVSDSEGEVSKSQRQLG